MATLFQSSWFSTYDAKNKIEQCQSEEQDNIYSALFFNRNDNLYLATGAFGLEGSGAIVCAVTSDPFMLPMLLP